MPNQNLSEEAQWFLKNIQRLNGDFSKELGIASVFVNKRGKVIFSTSPIWEMCKKIRETEEGARRCGECFQQAVSTFTSGQVKEPNLLNCHANFAALICPVKSGEKLIGGILACGGVYNKEAKEKAKELVLQIEGLKREEVERLIGEIKIVSKEEMRTKAERFSKLVGILAEESALSEVFEVI